MTDLMLSIEHGSLHRRLIFVLPDDDMADSFCLIPSKADPSVVSLKEENTQLKAELEKQRQQFASMEMALKARQEKDQQLRDSIMLARKEVSRWASCSRIHEPFPTCYLDSFR